MILCILQNQWFREPHRVKQILAGRPEEFRRAFIRRSLFAGCKTGKIIDQVFDCEEWTFDEVSREIGGEASSKFPADIGHLISVVTAVQPTTVISLGKISNEACRSLEQMKILKVKNWFYGPHPAARYNVIPELTAIAERLQTVC